MGAGAAALGLEGEVEAEAFGALIGGRDPSSGEVLRSASGRDRVCSLDLTFSAPKSVSVLFAIGDEQTSRSLVEAHEEAVGAALGYLEREACRVRRGHAGRIELAGGRVRGGCVSPSHESGGSAAACIRTWWRPIWPAVRMGGGRRCMAIRSSSTPRRRARCIRRSLRAGVSERLPWAQWGEVRKGMAELEGVPAGVLAHFSRRRAEIVAWLEAEQRSGRQSAEKAALATREPKADPVALAPWRERVRAEAAEHGFGRDELAALTRAVERFPARPVDLEQVGAFLAGPAGLTAQRNTFDDRHVVAGARRGPPDGARVADVEEASRAFLRRDDVVALATASGMTVDTPRRSLLACERRIVIRMRRQGNGRARRGRTRPRRPGLGGLPTRLSDEQVSGRARDRGQSQTRSRWSRRWRARARPPSRARWQRSMSGGVPRDRGGADRPGGTRAVKPRRHAREHAASPGRGLGSQRGIRIGPAVLLIDEAGMAPTRVSAERARRRSSQGIKVVALGDSGQLSSVEAGGWLGALSQTAGRARAPRGGPATRSGRAGRAGRAACAATDGGSHSSERRGGVGGARRRPAGGPGGGHGRLAGRRGGWESSRRS